MTSNDYETQAVMALLETAKAEGFGIAFIPVADEGWDIDYVSLVDWPAIHDRDLDAGTLSAAYDLETAAKAALKPLRRLSNEYDTMQRERREREG